MALNNCTITSQSFSKTGGQAIGSDNAVLTISPNSGYVVSASDFTNNTGALTGVSSITLSDTGTAGTINNTVRVTVDLDDNYVMPSADTTLTIDIDGDAELITYSLDGDYNTIESGTTTSSSATAYSANGNYQQEVTVFTKTFTADTDKYFAELPSYSITTGVASRYNITKVDTTNSDGYTTSRVYTVKYTFPNSDVSNDVIDFKATAVDIPNLASEITGYYIDDSSLPDSGENRLMQIFGGSGATFSVTVVDSGSNSIASVTSQTIPSSGIYDFNIAFPADANGETYTITISGDLSNTFDTANGVPSSFDIVQLAKVELTLEITTTDTDITTPSDNVKSFQPNITEFTTTSGEYEYDVHFDVTSTGNMYLTSGTIDEDSFSNQDDSDLDFYISKFTLTGNQSNNVDIDFTVNVRSTTDSSLTSTLDLDDFINTAPTANTVSDSVSKGDDTAITLSATDPDSGDTLTYYVVTLPSNGTLYSDSALTTAISAGSSITGSVVYYEHDDSDNLTDSFTYKANDGYEDSNTATVNIAVGVSPGDSLSVSSSGPGIYLIPFVIGTDIADLGVHFNAQGVPDRFQILFDTAGASNNIADMEVVADSLYVGDDVSLSVPANGTTTGLNEYTYVGSGGNATGTGEPGAAWNKTGSANQSITVSDSNVCSPSGVRTVQSPNGDSRDTPATASQVGAQGQGVYISSSATTLTTGLDHHDGNICLRYFKSSSTAYIAYFKVFAPTTGTAWDIFQTELAPL